VGNVGMIIAIVGTAVVNIGIIFVLFLWLYSEENNDRREIIALIRAMHDDLRQEMKEDRRN
jgi:heme/copper-type cytochrome/quinol oxidase subunit 4